MTPTVSDPVAVVVDTDVVSFTLKGDSRATEFARHLADRILVISFMTVAELDRWAMERNWGQARRDAMEQFLQAFTVHPSNRDLCSQWATIVSGAKKAGRAVSTSDAWIAATALALGVPLVTNNVKDYESIEGLRVLTVR